MKRKVYVGAGLLALTLAIVVAAQLRAQGTGAGAPKPAANAGPAPTTKIAIVNLHIISKHYNKVKTFNEETKQLAEPFVAEDKKLKAKHDELVAKGPSVANNLAEREKLESEIKDIQRRAEDNKMKAQKEVGKKNEAQIQILFRDIHDVITRLAQSRGYELVLHYNDITDSGEYWLAPNVAQKLQTRPLMPIYWVGGLDISNDVVTTLNGGVKPPQSQPPR